MLSLILSKEKTKRKRIVPVTNIMSTRRVTIVWLALLMFASLHPVFCLSMAMRESSRTVVLLYNKPAGVVTTHDENDIKGRMNVYQDVLSMRGFVSNGPTGKSLKELTGVSPTDWNAIGRLDAETSGLLLLTNDGGLVHHVTNKSSRTSRELGPLGKTYEAVIMGYHEDASTIISTIRGSGVDIGQKYGGQTEPAHDICVLGHPTQKTTKVSLTIYEGKNRQVRRMFHALGSGVIQLQRVAIGGNLTLADLREGQWRILSDEEVRDHLKWEPRAFEYSRRSSVQRRVSPLKNKRTNRKPFR